MELVIVSEPVKNNKSGLHASVLVFGHKGKYLKFAVCAVVLVFGVGSRSDNSGTLLSGLTHILLTLVSCME
jgi:hypothetical protein